MAAHIIKLKQDYTREGGDKFNFVSHMTHCITTYIITTYME